MLHLFWRFLAEGNAHLVYRYVGPPNDHFSGMVLKLPKDTAQMNQNRLLRQNKFVGKVVMECKLFPSEALDHEPLSVMLSKTSYRDELQEKLAVRDFKKNKSSIAVSKRKQNGQWKAKKATSSSQQNIFNIGMCHAVHYSSLGVLKAESILWFSDWNMCLRYHALECFPKRIASPFVFCHILYSRKHQIQHSCALHGEEKGLVSKRHIPFQKLHHLDEFHLLNMKNYALYEAHCLKAAQSENNAVSPNYIFETHRNPSRLHLGTFANAHSTLTDEPRTHSGSPIYSSEHDFTDETRNEELSSGVPSFGNTCFVKDSEIVSSYALLEKDLITPPVPFSDLLGFQDCQPCKLHSEYSGALSGKWKWIYLTCEIKPKTGLPIKAVHNNDLQHFVYKSSRFTFQQLLKVTRGEIGTQSFYDPCKFFGHMSNKKEILEQFRLLQEHPQNNCHLFLNGVRILWCDTQRRQAAIAKQRDAAAVLSKTVTCESRHGHITRPIPHKGSVYYCLCGSQQHTHPHRVGLTSWPNHIDIGSDHENHKDILSPIFQLFSGVVHKERNLFHRILYIHAFCEGQQQLAHRLLMCLVRRKLLRHKEAQTKTVESDVSLDTVEYSSHSPLEGHETTKDNESTKDISYFDTCISGLDVDNYFMSNDCVTLAIEEFSSTISEVIQEECEKTSKVQCARSENTQDVEMTIAQRVQFLHYTLGEELLATFEGLTSRHSDGELESLRKRTLYWIHRYLVGRTFLDCSIMLNLALSVGEKNTSNVYRRFTKLCDLSVDNLLDDNGPPGNPQEETSCMKSYIKKLCVFSPQLENLPKMSQKTSFEHGRTPPDSVTSPYRWRNVITLLRDLYNKRQSSSNTHPKQQSAPGEPGHQLHVVSIWYRVSLVDLDLKQASKIPRWAEQFTHLLDP